MTYREWTPEKPATPAFSKTWIVEAPWAHPLWRSYVFCLYDLTTEIPGAPAVIHRDGMTHELQVFALDPSKPVDPPVYMLQPANHGYQFKAESNDAAAARVIGLIEEIEAKTLTPDTDFRTMWDYRFHDGVSLHMKGGAA
ncbi:hypothetical protein [Rhizobium sp. SSA_523]|uniref:hypothetical protein n=1 Tax=Rhizobium sp. SSA_523 TaxID=2952477 RepID=UPI002091D204|nr:hypothetical protein [Rhizobium sp. SSA_523]MCO5730140.1 hypothetical protein [Rhizobium sp. SSA_523]WKC25204.1 hypothetical protein QTJ18_14555 [Rhizobium sp. SSA_523]